MPSTSKLLCRWFAHSCLSHRWQAALICAHWHLMMHTPSCAEHASKTAILAFQQVCRITAMPSLLMLQEFLKSRSDICLFTVQRSNKYGTLIVKLTGCSFLQVQSREALPSLLVTREVTEHVNVFHTLTDLLNVYISLRMLGLENQSRCWPCLPACLPVCLSVCMYVCLYVCLSVHLAVCCSCCQSE